jgi:hypothetical protein
MDSLATRLGEHAGYDIQMAEQDKVGTGLSAFDYVFMYVHKPLIPEVENALIGYARRGGSLFVLHHGIASAKLENPEWLEFLGIELFPGDHDRYSWGVIHHATHTMVNLNPGHFITTNGIRYEKETLFHSEFEPIFQGTFPAFDLSDTEIFLNQIPKDEQIEVLFGVTDGKGSIMQPTSGWYRETGKGRVFYYQAGHSVEDYGNPNFIRVLLNTLEWDPD